MVVGAGDDGEDHGRAQRERHLAGEFFIADIGIAELPCGGEDVAQLVAGFALDDEDAPGFELAVIRYAHGEAEHGV